MVFSHDWSAFYLIKTLGVTEFSVLLTLGFAVSRKKKYLKHLFNRLYKALYAKFGNDLQMHKGNQDRCLWFYNERQYFSVRLYPDLFQIQLDPPTHYFEIKPESDNLIEEVELKVDASNHTMINIAVPDQNRYNLAKAINAILNS